MWMIYFAAPIYMQMQKKISWAAWIKILSFLSRLLRSDSIRATSLAAQVTWPLASRQRTRKARAKKSHAHRVEISLRVCVSPENLWASDFATPFPPLSKNIDRAASHTHPHLKCKFFPMATFPLSELRDEARPHWFGGRGTDKTDLSFWSTCDE